MQWEKKTQKRKTQINYNLSFRFKWKKEKKSGKQTKQNEPIVWTEKKPSNRANNMKNNLFELPVELASKRANG